MFFWKKSNNNVHYTLNKKLLYYINILLHISRYTYVDLYIVHMYERFADMHPKSI